MTALSSSQTFSALEVEQIVNERIIELMENGRKYRSLFEKAPIGIFHSVADGRFLVANPAIARMLGYASPDELLEATTDIGTQIYADPAVRAEIIVEMIDTDDWIYRKNVLWRRKDGAAITVNITGRKVQDDAGNTAYFEGVVEDITERTKIERALHASEEKYRILFMESPDAYLVIKDGIFIDCNHATEVILRGDRSQIVGKSPDLLSPEFQPDGIRSSEAAESRIREALSLGNRSFEWLHKRLDDTELFVEVALASTILDGSPILFVSWRDITDRKKAESALELSEIKFRTLYDSTSDAVMLLDENGFFDCNKATLKIFGCRSQADFLVKQPWELSPPAQPCGTKSMTLASRHIARAVKNGSHCFEWMHRRVDDKSDFLTEVLLSSMQLNGKTCLQATVRDISERKKGEKELHDSRQELLDIIEFLPDATFVVDIEKRVILWNRAMEEMSGVSKDEMIGQGDYAYTIPFYGERRKNLIDLLEMDREELHAKYTNVKSKGDTLYAEAYSPTLYGGKGAHILAIVGPLYNASGERVGTIESVRDISDLRNAEEERLKLEKQLLHTQKLESLGVLAGGIAHDFNNLLMAIMGNADLALMRLNPESPAIGNLHRIEQAAANAADLAKQMLAYSGRGKFVVDIIDLNRLLEEMLHMLEVSISKKAALRLNKQQPLPGIEADPSQIRQIIMNLVINASEAIGDKDGTISITTGSMYCDDSYLKDVWLDEKIFAGCFVYLEVADTGCGMPKEVLTKLFDPFFTTKFTGRGLGMAAVQGIVRGHKGAIKVYSEAGKGTTFKVLIPASEMSENLTTDNKTKDEWRGSGTVLLVDDEETVRGVGKEMLDELGFTTITAKNGREAIEIFKANNRISFVILDLTMPQMDGEQCFRELRQINPEIKVIISSGYNEYEVGQKFLGKGLAGFIQKPYQLAVLKEAVKNI